MEPGADLTRAPIFNHKRRRPMGDAVRFMRWCYFFFGVTATLFDVTAETDEEPRYFTLTVNFFE